ncbi:hypothetical protein D1007_25578 [Hordeum vulgare]|nr:hypothetical protein D1007_25578 [Hordeum vulgare]
MVQLPAPAVEAAAVQFPTPSVEAASTPKAPKVDVIACAGVPLMPYVGENPEPAVPQVEGVDDALAMVAGCTGTTPPREALALVGQDVLLTRGPLTDARDMLAKLEVDFRDVEVRSAEEHARLAAGWRHLEASAKEAYGKAEAFHSEAAEAMAAHASALAEKEALTKC